MTRLCPPPTGVALRETAALEPVQEGEGEATGTGGREFRVILIREGLALSRRYFSRRVVEEIARAADGLRAFADHPTPTEDRERPVRSVKDMVGFYKDARTVEGKDAEGRTRLHAEARLHLFESAGWLATLVQESLACGYPGVVGLSIDSIVRMQLGRPEGLPREVMVVEELMELKSVDVVTRPSAGGRFVAAKESEMGAMETETVVQQSGAAGDAGEAAVTEAERLLGEVLEARLSFACEQALS